MNNDNVSETIAVFIDGDNISYKDIPYIIKEINKYDNIIINNIYSDWREEQYINLKQTSIEYGINTIQVDKINGKNSTDIKLMIDIMKSLYENNHITLYYIVTSDCDYKHIIPNIQMQNRKVNIIGTEQTNISLKNICNLFINIESLKPPVNTNLILLEINNIMKNNIKLNLGNLNTKIKDKYNYFNYKKYGCESISEFINNYYSMHYIVINNNIYNTSILLSLEHKM
tara:strand:+ start:4908 stop:5591 length:684 start_codon:yes stop_codon:yes gene_type:complete